MANTNSSKSQTAHFVGDYVEVTREAAIASRLSNVHLLLISKPGTGKTSMVLDLAKRMAGKFSFSRLNPTTPVEVIEGLPDPAALLDSPPRYELKREGTPYQDDNEIAVLDELFRPGDPIFDKLLDTLDMEINPNESWRSVFPTIWATTNFIVQNERTEALIDRIGLWVWIDPGVVDADMMLDALIESNGRPTMPGAIPTKAEIEKVRATPLTDKAKSAVKRFLLDLTNSAREEKREPNGRRFDQWQKIARFVSVFEHGTGDFDEVSPMAKRVLQYAWPTTTAAEAATWANVVTATFDKVGAAIDATLADAAVAFREFAQLPADERGARLTDFGVKSAGYQQTLKVFSDDERTAEALGQIQIWFGKAASGVTEGIG